MQSSRYAGHLRNIYRLWWSELSQDHSDSGTVTFDGKPVDGATVTFIPTEGKIQPATGRTDAQGKYSLTTFRSGDGAQPGAYQVTVTKYFSEAGASPYNSPPVEAAPDTPAEPPKTLEQEYAAYEKAYKDAPKGLASKLVQHRRTVTNCPKSMPVQTTSGLASHRFGRQQDLRSETGQVVLNLVDAFSATAGRVDVGLSVVGIGLRFPDFDEFTWGKIGQTLNLPLGQRKSIEIDCDSPFVLKENARVLHARGVAGATTHLPDALYLAALKGRNGAYATTIRLPAVEHQVNAWLTVGIIAEQPQLGILVQDCHVQIAIAVVISCRNSS